MRHTAPFLGKLLLLAVPTFVLSAADRIPGRIDSSRTRTLTGNVHNLAQPQFDLGPADPQTPMHYMVMLLQPSPAQQSELAQLIADQQNSASPRYHQWLTPEDYAARFGVAPGDLAKISAWLTEQGFKVEHQARSANWIAFSGTAALTSQAFHTAIHRYSVNGETHIANATDPQIPEALSGIAAGFIGLNDFRPAPMSRIVNPGAGSDYNLSGQHFLAPSDFATIYDLLPLQQAGFDGTGQAIVIVGVSDVLATDLSSFRTRYGLPANTPKMLLYSGVDPGFNGAQMEGELDLEWAGAIAPKATLYYVYGDDPFAAMVASIESDVAPIISVSYSGCEVGYAATAYEAVAQQASAQGITILAASGDSGAAGCDLQGLSPQATLGRSVNFPAVLPEVTAMGGTSFVEGTGTYWGPSNSSTFGSALSYIPETAWNESDSSGLGATGGGASRFFTKPAWQTGPGVPNDSARDVPDLAFSSAAHDAYEIYYLGQNFGVAGTSCATPTMAGVVALLNQYQIKNGKQTSAGLGNINPQLYRLAQAVPSAFHDVTSGNNIVSCALGTADCANGSFGYTALPAYDQTTGLGSIDANVLFTQWNSSAQRVTVTLSSSVSKATLNDTINLTATVAPAAGAPSPSGSVSFTWIGGAPLGSVPLALNGKNLSATLSLPLYNLAGPGTYYFVAQYSGDGVFSGGGAQIRVQVSAPTGVAAVTVIGPNTVFPPVDLDAQGLSWPTTFTLHEYAGVGALLTGFAMDGAALNLSQTFPSPDIPASGTLTGTLTLRNVNAPALHTFTFNGVDATGAAWSRQVSVNFYPPPPQDQYSFTASPLTVTQTLNPNCQFPVHVNLNDSGGYINVFDSLYAGSAELVNQLASTFGTTRLGAFQSLDGTICLNGITPPGSDYVYAIRGDNFEQQVQVNFASAPANPTTISVTPAIVSLSAGAVSQTAQATLSVNIADKTQPWTAAIYPANRTTGWLTASQLSGTGPAQIAFTASGFGYEPGAYKAWIVIQCQNAQPQFVSVPIMFVLGASNNLTISSVADPASGQASAAPGSILSVFGSNLSPSTQTLTGTVLPFAAGAVTATVNNLAAPLLYVSPTQINLQIPYEVGAGPAVLGINNNGQVAGYQFTVAPAAPSIYTDGSGNLLGNPSVAPGASATLYLNGAGDVTPALLTGNAAPTGVAIAPVLPLSITVGGAPAIVKAVSLAPNDVGVTQLQFYVPLNASSGPQPVVVTVNGVASPPVNVNVQPSK